VLVLEEPGRRNEANIGPANQLRLASMSCGCMTKSLLLVSAKSFFMSVILPRRYLLVKRGKLIYSRSEIVI